MQYDVLFSPEQAVVSESRASEAMSNMHELPQLVGTGEFANLFTVEAGLDPLCVMSKEEIVLGPVRTSIIVHCYWIDPRHFT